MADISTELATYLAGQTQGLVGTGSDARIFGDFVKQSATRPYIVLFEGGGQALPLLVGAAGIAQSSFQVWSFADTPGGSVELWELVRVSIDRFQGYMGDLWIQEITQIGWRETGVIQPRDNSPQRLFWAQSTYDIWHEVATVNHSGV